AEIRSTKASFSCQCLCDTDRSARKDPSAVLGMTTPRSAIKILRRFIIFRAAPPFRISHF
ncbi:MAG: hypothetical protein SO089_07195, partial [Dialister sp.]|nr:hypothetical protein [Dialister sp.]